MKSRKIVDELNKLILKQGKGLGAGAAVSGPFKKDSRLASGLGFQSLEPSKNASPRLIRTADFSPGKLRKITRRGVKPGA